MPRHLALSSAHLLPIRVRERARLQGLQVLSCCAPHGRSHSHTACGPGPPVVRPVEGCQSTSLFEFGNERIIPDSVAQGRPRGEGWERRVSRRLAGNFAPDTRAHTPSEFLLSEFSHATRFLFRPATTAASLRPPLGQFNRQYPCTQPSTAWKARSACVGKTKIQKPRRWCDLVLPSRSIDPQQPTCARQ